MRAREIKPTEIQVYSLFTFSGDFDIQTDYILMEEEPWKYCRAKFGLVLQTLGDEKSYKFYVATKPGKELFFRSRLDHQGEDNQEMQKGAEALMQGTLRAVRTGGSITLFALAKGIWEEVYTFQSPCSDKLRIRFKLQTDANKDENRTCAFGVQFDNFKVNSCDRIIEE